MPRRRLQFGLRTLLIAVTLFCAAGGYVAHEANLVRQRRSLQEQSDVLLSWSDKPAPKIPWLRSWLGDVGYSGFCFSDSTTDETLSRYRTAFPEAVVLRDSDWSRRP